MKIVEQIRTFLDKLIGDHPEQYVETDDLGALVVADGGSTIKRQDLAELAKALKDAEKSGKEFDTKLDKSIKLDADEVGYNTTSKSEKETAYRDSEGMKSIRNNRKDTSAKDLPNSEREKGGEVRNRTR